MTVEAPYYPIVFLRGFAMSDGDVAGAANQVYQGYEVGSTRRRRDGGVARKPVFFESVVVRLMKDHGYCDNFRDNLYGWESTDPVPARSLWVHRYYDDVDKDFGDGKRHPMQAYAIGLRRTILRIRDKLNADGLMTPDAFRIHLVAHSMGGLVARCYLQNICRHGTGDKKLDAELELPVKDPEGHYVERFFTFGAPHNGIDADNGLNVPPVGPVQFNQVGVFNRDEIRKYLALPKSARANDLDGALDVDRAFCLIGTAYRDYDIGVSKWATGGPGDGLVRCQNAYTQGLPRAFVRRAHGGPYGMVNSEEGYQNLRRFLFGDWRVDAEVILDEVRLPDKVAAKVDKGDVVTAEYLLDVAASVRGEDVQLHERRISTEFAVVFTQPYKVGDDTTPTTVLDAGADQRSQVASLFLIAAQSAETAHGEPGPMLFSLRFALEASSFQFKQFLIPGSLPGFKVFAESYQIRIDPEAGQVLWSPAADGLEAPARTFDRTKGNLVRAKGFTGEIPFGPAADAPLASGQARGRIRLTVSAAR